jgi:zinc transport system permease protein
LIVKAYFGDSISHSSIFGLGIAALLSINQAIGILIFVIFFTFLISFLDKTNLHSKETTIATTSYIFLAIALILIANFPDKINLNSYLLGDIISSSISEIILIYINSLLVVLMMIFMFKKLLLITISEDLASIKKISVTKLNLIFTLMLALTIVILVKVAGIFLVTAMLIIPAATARNLANNPISMLWHSLTISIISVIFGILTSIHLDYPTSPTIIAFMATLLLLTTIIKSTMLRKN